MATTWLKKGHPIAQVYVSAVFVTLSELALKIGADQTAHAQPAATWIGLTGLASHWVWAGIILGLISMVIWLAALRRVPLSVAFLHSNIVYVTVPISCWLWLGETISPQRWLGTVFVLASILCIAQPIAKTEDPRMNAAEAILLLALASQLLYVGGELLLKAAMNQTQRPPIPWARFLVPFFGGCAGIAGSFLLWLGLLGEKPLSYLYPLRSLNTVIIALGAAIFLREKLTPRLLLSLLLVTIGVSLVLAS